MRSRVDIPGGGIVEYQTVGIMCSGQNIVPGNKAMCFIFIIPLCKIIKLFL
jgi:hypothetical protein